MTSTGDVINCKLTIIKILRKVQVHYEKYLFPFLKVVKYQESLEFENGSNYKKICTNASIVSCSVTFMYNTLLH